MTGDDWLTRAQAAALAGVRTSTWGAYVHRGLAPAPARHVGRTPVWTKGQVERWKVSRPGRGARTDLRHDESEDS